MSSTFRVASAVEQAQWTPTSVILEPHESRDLLLAHTGSHTLGRLMIQMPILRTGTTFAVFYLMTSAIPIHEQTWISSPEEVTRLLELNEMYLRRACEDAIREYKARLCKQYGWSRLDADAAAAAESREFVVFATVGIPPLYLFHAGSPTDKLVYDYLRPIFDAPKVLSLAALAETAPVWYVATHLFTKPAHLRGKLMTTGILSNDADQAFEYGEADAYRSLHEARIRPRPDRFVFLVPSVQFCIQCVGRSDVKTLKDFLLSRYPFPFEGLATEPGFPYLCAGMEDIGTAPKRNTSARLAVLLHEGDVEIVREIDAPTDPFAQSKKAREILASSNKLQCE